MVQRMATVVGLCSIALLMGVAMAPHDSDSLLDMRGGVKVKHAGGSGDCTGEPCSGTGTGNCGTACGGESYALNHCTGTSSNKTCSANGGTVNNCDGSSGCDWDDADCDV